MSEARNNPNIDGGWAWAVAMAGCLIHFLMGANNKGGYNGVGHAKFGIMKSIRTINRFTIIC